MAASQQPGAFPHSSMDLPLAAALGGLLLGGVLFLYWAYDRIIGIDNMKLG